MYVCMYVCICMYNFLVPMVWRTTHLFACFYTHMHVRIYIHIHTCIYIYTYVYTHMYAIVHIPMYGYIHTQMLMHQSETSVLDQILRGILMIWKSPSHTRAELESSEDVRCVMHTYACGCLYHVHTWHGGYLHVNVYLFVHMYIQRKVYTFCASTEKYLSLDIYIHDKVDACYWFPSASTASTRECVPVYSYIHTWYTGYLVRLRHVYVYVCVHICTHSTWILYAIWTRECILPCSYVHAR
jgi:hypothetical protein